MKKLILIDGNAIFYRAFHALPLFKNAKGEYTNAIYGFLRMLFDIYLKENPDYVGIAWDSKEKTFRHIEYEEYKATRPPPPAELYPQLPRLKEVLEAFNIPLVELPGYEADDILGALSAQAEANTSQDFQTIIVTGDKDALQLVTAKTHVLTPVTGISQTALYDPAKVEEKMGVRPDQIIDYKALCGDNSDNIKGVQGIGPKQAVELLKKYGHLQNIYDHLSDLPPGQHKKLTEGKESAFQSQKLATIQRDIPISFDPETYRAHRDINFEKIRTIFEDLEFKLLLKKLDDLQLSLEHGHAGIHPDATPVPFKLSDPAPKPQKPSAKTPDPAQQSLF